jgi:serine protease Do
VTTIRARQTFIERELFDQMNVRWMLKPLLVGALGAVLGASSIMFVSSHERSPSAGVAVANGEDDQQRIVEAVKHVEPSVVALDVNINGAREMPANPFGNFFLPGFGSAFGQFGGGRQLVPFHEQASGSGFVYSKSGLILTNDHVVHGASKIQVVFANGDHITGHILSENGAADLALVKVDHYAKLPPPVTFGSSRAVEQGEWAIAIGEPYALKQTVTLGVVSGFDRNETIGGQAIGVAREFKGLLQTSAPINPGNSGGPLVDLDGQVIGVNQSVERPAQGIGFAIPVNVVRTTVAMLAHHPGTGMGASSIGFLGVRLQALDASVRAQLGYPGNGAVVMAVVGGSPADRAGLQPGDVIQIVNGKAVRTPADVSAIVRGLAPGKTASLSVWRNGTRDLVAVQIGSRLDRSAS